MSIKNSAAVFFAIVISGCAGSTHKVACTGEDWHQLGFEYASEGKSVRTFNQYRDQCGKNLEQNAMDEYLDGYTKGLVEYCTFDNGYERGLNNLKPLEICPAEMRTAYNEGYRRGKILGEQKLDNFERVEDEQRRKFERRREMLDNAAMQDRGR